MLTENEKTEYAKIAEELQVMARRMADLSEAGYDDMEGSDRPAWDISLCLYSLQTTAESVRNIAQEITRLLSPNIADEPQPSKT
jgi:hypothetical protein